LTTILNEISIIPEHFLLILDEYHLLDSQLVDQALTFIVEHQLPQMHLVIASREDPALPLAPLRFIPAAAADIPHQHSRTTLWCLCDTPQGRYDTAMKESCTYLIQLRGQVDEAEINALSPFPMLMEWGDTTATLFTISTNQSGILQLMRHLHQNGFIFLAMNCKR